MLLPVQAPGAPDPATLKDLPTPVAILLLCLIGLLALLFYFGGAVRDRMTGKKSDTTPPSLNSGAAPVATPAMDQASEMANRYIADLQRRNQILEEQADKQARQIDELRNELEALRLEVQRVKYRRDSGY